MRHKNCEKRNRTMIKKTLVAMMLILLLGAMSNVSVFADETASAGNTTANNNAEAVQTGTDSTDSLETKDQGNTQEATQEAVYLNGRSGNDSGDGSSAENAVKTFARAKESLRKMRMLRPFILLIP